MVGHVTGYNIAKFHDQNQNIKKTTVDLRNALQLISFNQMPGDLKKNLGCVYNDDTPFINHSCWKQIHNDEVKMHMVGNMHL